MAEISQQAVQAGAGMPPGNNVCTQREQNKWGINGPAKHACNSRKEPGAEQQRGSSPGGRPVCRQTTGPRGWGYCCGCGAAAGGCSRLISLTMTAFSSLNCSSSAGQAGQAGGAGGARKGGKRWHMGG